MRMLFCLMWLKHVRNIFFVLTIISSSVILFADEAKVGEALEFYSKIEKSPSFETFNRKEWSASSITGGFTIDPNDREESKEFFLDFYMISDDNPDVSIDWMGNYLSCDEGDTAQEFRDAVLRRLNYFRAMAGVPADITFDTTFNEKAQKAALMMSRNNALSHNPPETWDCFSNDGAEAATNANLSLGVFGKDGIDLFIKDSGDGNSAVGHRRWVLFPQAQIMGTGDVPGNQSFMPAQALWVIDPDTFGTRPNTREEFVAWPPSGFVPYQVVFARWSFSFPGASFANATVLMTSNDKNVPVKLESVKEGFGENTLVWIPNNMNNSDDWPKPSKDTVYTINIDDVTIDGIASSFSYGVTIFDPTSQPVSEKSFTFSCNENFQIGPAGLEKMVMNIGENENCVLKVTNHESGVPIAVSTNFISDRDSSVNIEPFSGITNENGELDFNVTAVNRGIVWVSWAVQNDNGEFEFTKKAYDTGRAWGAFFLVR